MCTQAWVLFFSLLYTFGMFPATTNIAGFAFSILSLESSENKNQYEITRGSA
jgi:hypothetical protein